jgi:hypothetical protein
MTGPRGGRASRSARAPKETSMASNFDLNDLEKRMRSTIENLKR